jgi:hypothetical protein
LSKRHCEGAISEKTGPRQKRTVENLHNPPEARRPQFPSSLPIRVQTRLEGKVVDSSAFPKAVFSLQSLTRD